MYQLLDLITRLYNREKRIHIFRGSFANQIVSTSILDRMILIQIVLFKM